MKRQKPMFSKDWADEFTPWLKWWYRKMERIRGKRKLQMDMKNQFYPETWIKEYERCKEDV